MTVVVKKKPTSKSNSWTYAFGIGILTLGFILALGSYHADDSSLNSYSSSWRPPHNVLGYIGSWTSDIFFQVFGWGAWLWPILLFVALSRWLVLKPRKQSILGTRWWAALGLLLSASSLFFDLIKISVQQETYPIQGLWGFALSAACKPLVGTVGSYLVVCVLLWTFCLVWWENLPAHIVDGASHLLGGVVRFVQKHTPRAFNFTKKFFAGDERIKTPIPAVNIAPVAPIQEIDSRQPAIRVGEQTPSEKLKASKAPIHRPSGPKRWDLPPLSLLEGPKRKIKALTEDKLLETAKKITSALKSFEVDGEVMEISPGPIITMYEFQPAPGVRVQKIVSAATDLAMTLGVPSVRIVAPIPGKSVAGIEVPNPDT